MRLIVSLSFCAILIGLSLNGIDAFWPRNFMRGYHNKYNNDLNQCTRPSTTKPPDQKLICPKYNKVEADTHKPFNKFRYTTSLIDKLWTSPVSKTAQKLKDLVRQMDRGRNPIWKAVAGSLATWLGNTLPQIDVGIRPDLCRYAMIINISAAAGANPMDCDVLGGIMDGLLAAGRVNAEFVSKATRLKAGCKPEFENPPFLLACYMNGEVYNRDGLWALNGPNYLPFCFQQMVKNLSQSSDFKDKYIAAVATVVTTKPMVNFYKNLSPNSTLQALALQSVANIDQRCCDDLNRDIKETCALSASSMQDAKKLSLIANGCTVDDTTRPPPHEFIIPPITE